MITLLPSLRKCLFAYYGLEPLPFVCIALFAFLSGLVLLKTNGCACYGRNTNWNQYPTAPSRWHLPDGTFPMAPSRWPMSIRHRLTAPTGAACSSRVTRSTNSLPQFVPPSHVLRELSSVPHPDALFLPHCPTRA